MYKYLSLLKQSITSIVDVEDEKEVLSLFKAGGTATRKSEIKGIEDLTLFIYCDGMWLIYPELPEMTLKLCLCICCCCSVFFVLF